MSLAWVITLACLTFAALAGALAQAYGTCLDVLMVHCIVHPTTPLSRMRVRWTRIRRWWRVYSLLSLGAAVLWAGAALGRW